MRGALPDFLVLVVVFGLLAWLAWAVRSFKLLSAFLWTLIVVDLAFVALLAFAESAPDNTQAGVVLVYMVAVDALLSLVFAVVGMAAWLLRRRTAHRHLTSGHTPGTRRRTTHD